jgi:hypothetical protein
MSFLADEPVERVLWAVLLLLVGGYLVGAWLNRKRSQRLGMWLQRGMEGLGRRPTWRWIRSITSGAQLTIGEPAQPFEQLEITYVLLTREVPLLWAIERLRGKSDLLRVRASLHREPAEPIEVLPLNSRYRRMLDEHADDEAWQWETAGPDLGVATHSRTETRGLRAVQVFVSEYGAYVERLSWRRRRPHLVLFLRLTGLEKTPAAQVFMALRELGRAQPRS